MLLPVLLLVSFWLSLLLLLRCGGRAAFALADVFGVTDISVLFGCFAPGPVQGLAKKSL